MLNSTALQIQEMKSYEKCVRQNNCRQYKHIDRRHDELQFVANTRLVKNGNSEKILGAKTNQLFKQQF